LGGVAGTPIVVDVTAALQRPEPDSEIAEAACAAVVEPWGDVLAPSSYRRDVAGAVAVRAYRAACHYREVEHGGS
jgi:CO/xanthine dehydrogenase FAD-binding subunit